MFSVPTSRQWTGGTKCKYFEEYDLKDRKSRVEELCYDLNNMRRIEFKASPRKMFFNRPVKGHLPNQFAKENEIRESIEKRISNQFEVALKN